MSKEEGSIGFTVAEKFFALIIILIGAIVIYNTNTSPGLLYPILFTVGGLALVILGAIMILANP